jgi:hypothetical protein
VRRRNAGYPYGTALRELSSSAIDPQNAAVDAAANVAGYPEIVLPTYFLISAWL